MYQYANPVQNTSTDLESLYPEIYKIVYPMVKKVCMQKTKPISEEMLDDMVNEI